ncbi:histidine phosphotransferase family protein [Marivita sp. S0852]|uniref:histidine phosphotransferase family protein n=1 Tax=Marivita sp. S0852 TaxID=3373893 RepID=UPI003981B357
MQNEPSSLAALIGSRICHDLINPIGAISNGLELVSMGAPAPVSPEMSLIQQSCDNATARIQFFRIAFGSAGETRPVPRLQAEKTLADHYTGTRITPEWCIPDATGRHIVQLAYLGVMCMEIALPQGGVISVASDATHMSITATGPALVRDSDLWSWLESPQGRESTELRPAHVQFALLAELCDGQALTTHTQALPEALVLRIALPAADGDPPA